MKKFKLIKKYPGSPELGTISGIVGDSSLFKDNPEFWEELTEYPIGTKVRDIETNFIYTKGKGGSWDFPLKEEEIGKRFEVVEGKPLLPEKYQVKCSNAKETSIVLNTLGDFETKNWQFWDYVTYDSKQGQTSVNPNIYTKKQDGYTEISFEYFKKCMLDKEVSKDYLILSFFDGFNINNRYDNEFSINLQHKYKEEDLLNSPNWKIRSVKRLRDGEAFRVGDKTSIGTITSIFLEKDTIYLKLDTGETCPLNCEELKKKKYLFKSEDGESIFEGDTFYVVDSENFSSGVTTRTITSSEVKTFFDKNKYYANKDFALKKLEQLKMEYYTNLPCLSIKDIQTIYVSSREGYRKNGVGISYFEKLIDLVKKKKG